MNKQNDIQDELRGWNSPLADMSRIMPYYVPANYFGQLQASMAESVKAAYGIETIATFSTKAMPYTVPQGYFEQLPQQIIAAIHSDTLISTLPKQNPMAVPTGYFDALPEQILAGVKEAQKPKTKVISLGADLSNTVRWAAAAVLLFFVSVSSYQFLSAEPMTAEQEIAQLPKGAINDYISNNIDDFDTDLLVSNIAAPADPLQDVSKQDILNYLDENGWSDAALNL